MMKQQVFHLSLVSSTEQLPDEQLLPGTLQQPTLKIVATPNIKPTEATM